MATGAWGDPHGLGSLFDVTGKVVFMPGGYGGIGEAIAWGLAMRGATVVLAGRSEEKGSQLAQQIREAGFAASSAVLEAREVPRINEVVDEIVRRHGSVDVLINLVGFNFVQPLVEVTAEVFDQSYEVNIRSAMFLAQAVARHQIPRNAGGKHVHLLSLRSHLGWKGKGLSAYCAAKGALAMLVRQHAAELSRHQIQVNGIAPSFTETPLIRAFLADEKFRTRMFERIPLGRIGQPRDIVGAALFFASAASDYVTGQILNIDGGITATDD